MTTSRALAFCSIFPISIVGVASFVSESDVDPELDAVSIVGVAGVTGAVVSFSRLLVTVWVFVLFEIPLHV